MRIDRKLLAIAIVGSLGLAAVPAHADSIFRFGTPESGRVIQVDGSRHGGGWYGSRHGGDRWDGRERRRERRVDANGVRQILRRNGFHDIAPPQYFPKGDVYITTAENRRNHEVRIHLEARTGRILNVTRIDRGPRHGQGQANPYGPGRYRNGELIPDYSTGNIHR